MLSYFLLAIFLYLIITNYKNGVLAIAFILQPLTYIGSGIGDVSLYYVMAAVALALLPFTYYSKYIKSYPKLLLIPTSLMAISYLVTNSICKHPKTVLILSNIVTQFLFPLVLWCVLSSRKSLDRSVKIIVYMCLLSTIVMIPEMIFKHNYFTDFVTSNFAIADFYYDTTTVRYGLKRINSIFSYFSTSGMYGYLSAFILWIIAAKYKSKKNIYFVLFLLMIFLSFSSGSRATFLGIFCILIGLFTDKKIQEKSLFRIIICLSILLLPLVANYVGDIVDSIVNSDTSKSATGSSADMRLLQWEACLPSFEESPIWGNGRMYIWEEVAPRFPILQGAESIFFSLSVDYGIMGIITYIIMIICCSIFLFRIESRLAFLPIGYFLILSLSPDVGIQYNQLLSFSVLSYKLIDFRRNKNEVFNHNSSL